MELHVTSREGDTIHAELTLVRQQRPAAAGGSVRGARFTSAAAAATAATGGGASPAASAERSQSEWENDEGAMCWFQLRVLCQV